eukprot:TRINITY_DN67918_c0_g1_i1.p1 TRINITY_DN67918_c0_g1~~TRINITY_DN67918_c0_g1_i1.p1  ORF type:complete len:1066 (-),score=181.53 TRINITY_DN67918_c0_g1_i1:46-3141(-)
MSHALIGRFCRRNVSAPLCDGVGLRMCSTSGHDGRVIRGDVCAPLARCPGRPLLPRVRSPTLRSIRPFTTRMCSSALGLPSSLVSACSVAPPPPVGARGFGVRQRNRGNVYVTRLDRRKTLAKATRRYPDNTLLLPPYISVGELRVIFRVDYAGAFRLLGVRREAAKYFWKDHEGREFETSSKRKIILPFDIAAVTAQGLGFMPKMVDVEPDWDESASKSIPPVPVVAVLGHIDHGKTTLLDALSGTAVAASEPGGITQEVRAMTGHLVKCASDLAPHAPHPAGFETVARLPLVALAADPQKMPEGISIRADAKRSGRLDPTRITFLDTPGHEAFEIQRGRTMAAADVAIVVVSVEHGAEIQTEEVLLHASRWKVPVVFALNKIDLPDVHVELTRAELRRQCQRLHEEGLVDVDWTSEAEAAVPISALRGLYLEKLVGRVHEVLESVPSLPGRPPVPPTRTLGEARKCKNVLRRTDYLVGVEAAPNAVALVVEYERSSEQGEHILTLIVRNGRLTTGQYFVVGTVFGRITYLAVADGSGTRSFTPCETATVGVAVQVMGIRHRYGGDCSPDDLLFTFPVERAWRLSEHRRRIEALTSVQTAGPSIEVPWEHDSFDVGGRTQAAFDRSRRDHPEKHSGSAYDRRWEQAAVEEISNASSPNSPSLGFSDASRRDFKSRLQREERRGNIDTEESEDAKAERLFLEDGDDIISGRTAGGRRSARKRDTISAPDEGSNGATASESSRRKGGSRFEVLMPCAEPREADAESPDVGRSGGGRRSRGPNAESGGSSSDAARAASGAWTAGGGPEESSKEDFIYYTDRKTWTEEADIDSTRLRARWQGRDVARWQEEQRQLKEKEEEKRTAEKIRRKVFGEDPEETDEEDNVEIRQEFERDEVDAVQPLPPKNRPVVSMILKTRSSGQFDVLMDEVERVQDAYQVRIIIVHGGLGPVIPKDVVHAEVEKSYGFCPIYAFQVGVHPVAAGHADKEQIDILRFDVFTDLVLHIVDRCERIQRKDAVRAYAETLKVKPTLSGL